MHTLVLLIKVPNPEDPGAYDMAFNLASKVGASVIFATDPDCDRLGVAVKDGAGEWHLLSGNQIGCVLLHYILWSTMVALLLMEMIVFSPKLINRHNPNTENIRVNPAEVVEQIQKDVERTDSETDEEQADSQSDGEQKDAKSDTEKKKVE